LMEQGKNAVLPTAGIAPVARPAQQIQEVQQEQQQQAEEQPVVEPEAVVEEQQPQPQTSTYDKYRGKIAARLTNSLYRYVNGNREKLGITLQGKIITNMAKKNDPPPEESDFNNVMDFLLGRVANLEHKKSGEALLRRLTRTEEIKDLIHQSALRQQGTGRRRKQYIVQLKTKAIKTAKTRGLVRFKPILWNKIPV
jgi:hypothetical protein